MNLTRTVARPLLAGVFVTSGIDTARHPDERAKRAEPVARAIAVPLGLPDDPVLLVRVNGAAQAAAGSLLAMGKLPRLAAAVLAGSLVPTTVAGHRFWEEVDDAKRSAQRIHFLKNLAMLGGLILVIGDRRPSRRRRSRKASGGSSARLVKAGLPLVKAGIPLAKVGLPAGALIRRRLAAKS